jgi:hypothetical protein
MNNDYYLYKEPHVPNLVFISGITRSGKGLLCPIVSSLENSDKVNVNFFLEQSQYLHAIHKLSTETAVYLLRSGMNLMGYDNALGRNSNFRVDDYTSVLKFREPLDYISRLFKKDGDNVFSDINSKNKIFPMMIHNGVWHSKLLFKAFPTLKILHTSRSPIEIVYSWIGKKYGGDFYTNPRSNALTYMYNNHILPYYAFGWEDEYLSLCDTDRIIKMIAHLTTEHQKSYDTLSQKYKERILFVRHKELASNPKDVLCSITSFLDTETTDYTDVILAQENCPRTFSTVDLSRKKNKIKETSSNDMFSLLLEMESVFNSSSISI